jgi:hypothetical protein
MNAVLAVPPRTHGPLPLACPSPRCQSRDALRLLGGRFTAQGLAVEHGQIDLTRAARVETSSEILQCADCGTVFAAGAPPAGLEPILRILAGPGPAPRPATLRRTTRCRACRRPTAWRVLDGWFAARGAPVVDGHAELAAATALGTWDERLACSLCGATVPASRLLR